MLFCPILLADITHQFTLFKAQGYQYLKQFLLSWSLQIFKTEITLWSVKPNNAAVLRKRFEERRCFLLQEWSENAVMLYKQAARTLLYHLTMMIYFCTLKGTFVPNSQTIIHLFSIFHAPHLWEEGYIMAPNVYFSLLGFSLLFTVLDRIVFYCRGQIWTFSS